MKKLVLILVSAFFLTIIISFNYIIWVRGQQVKNYKEQVEEYKDNQTLTSNARKADYDSYLSQLGEKSKEIQRLTGLIASLNEGKKALEDDIQSNEKSLEQKNGVINKLLSQTDIKPLEDTVRKWISAINEEQYVNAYKMLNNNVATQDDVKKLTEFVNNYRNVLEKFDLKSIELYKGETNNSKNSNIIFKVTIDVKIADTVFDSEYYNGLNERYFSLTVNNNKWVISSVTVLP